MTAARSHSAGDHELEVFLDKAVARAKALAGPLLDVEDLEQAARLALLEAKSKAPTIWPGRSDPVHSTPG